MTGSTLSAGRGLILALDVDNAGDAIRLVRRLRGSIDAVKIGWPLIVRAGSTFDVFRAVRDAFDGPILADTKIQDVPHIAIETLSTFAERGVFAATAWSHTGALTLQACRTRVPQVELFVLTGLTSDPYEIARDSVARGLVAIREAGCRHCQAPGNYPELVRHVRDSGFVDCIIACGIGAQGGEVGEAVAAGADYEIVGRDIYLSADPEAAAVHFRDRIHSAIARRTDAAR